MDKIEIVLRVSQGVSLLMFLGLVSFLFLRGSPANYLIAKGMVSAAFLLGILISWKNQPMGGGILLIVGSIGLVVIMGNQLPASYFLVSLPYFAAGALFIGNYLYQERMEEKEEIDL